MNGFDVPYNILLPNWVFDKATNEKEVEENALSYLGDNYADRLLIKIEGKFAQCEIK